MLHFQEEKLGTRHVKGTFTVSSSAFLHPPPPPPPPFFRLKAFHTDYSQTILGDPGAVSRDDRMFVVKVYCKIDLTENFHHKHSIVPTSCPWVSEDAPSQTDVQCQECPSQTQRKLTGNIRFFQFCVYNRQLKRNKYYGISQNNVPVTFQRNDAMVCPFLSFFLEMME